jgi:hypothetical protein
MTKQKFINTENDSPKKKTEKYRRRNKTEKILTHKIYSLEQQRLTQYSVDAAA